MTVHRVYLAVIVLLSLGASGCGSDSFDKTVTPVRVMSSQAADVVSPVAYTASVIPYSQVELDFKVDGYVKEILQVGGADGRMRDIQAGDPVQIDMVLAVVDETQYLAKVVEAEAQLAEAAASLQKGTEDFRRAETLYSTESIIAPTFERARKEYKVALAQVAGAQAQVVQAAKNLSDCRLKPPANGVILKRYIEVGTLVRPGSQGFLIADVTSVKVLFSVPDVTLGDVRLGQEMAVTTESLKDTVFLGQITEIAPSADARSRVFNVEITIQNPENLLKPGMITSLSIDTGGEEKPVILLPLGSIVRSTSKQPGYAVFVIESRDGGTYARRRDVELGSVYGNRIAVASGILSGEQVIIMGSQIVFDGDRVNIIP